MMPEIRQPISDEMIRDRQEGWAWFTRQMTRATVAIVVTLLLMAILLL